MPNNVIVTKDLLLMANDWQTGDFSLAYLLETLYDQNLGIWSTQMPIG
jgi:hypothetical protein